MPTCLLSRHVTTRSHHVTNTVHANTELFGALARRRDFDSKLIDRLIELQSWLAGLGSMRLHDMWVYLRANQTAGDTPVDAIMSPAQAVIFEEVRRKSVPKSMYPAV